MNLTLKLILGAIAGGAAGFGYYNLVGCPTGGCPLTRHPWITILYGAILGMLLASSGQ